MYENTTKQPFPDSIRMGVVLKNAPESPLRQHLILNSSKFNTWKAFKTEVTNILQAQAATTQGPMDIGALVKGGKKGDHSKVICHNCGKLGHLQKDCYAAGGAAAGGKGSKGKGRGKGGKGHATKGEKGGKNRQGGAGAGKGKGPTCWKCGGRGHIGKDRPSKKHLHQLDSAGGQPAASSQQAQPQQQVQPQATVGGAQQVNLGSLSALSLPGLFISILEIGHLGEQPSGEGPEREAETDEPPVLVDTDSESDGPPPLHDSGSEDVSPMPPPAGDADDDEDSDDEAEEQAESEDEERLAAIQERLDVQEAIAADSEEMRFYWRNLLNSHGLAYVQEVRQNVERAEEYWADKIARSSTATDSSSSTGAAASSSTGPNERPPRARFVVKGLKCTEGCCESQEKKL